MAAVGDRARGRVQTFLQDVTWLRQRTTSARTSPASGQQMRAMFTLSVVAGLLVAAMCLPLVGGVSLIAKRAAVAFNELPSELQPGQLAQRSTIVADDGSPIANLAGAEDRVVVPIDQISIKIQKAIVAIEDNRFFEHHGIDFRGLVRAALKNGSDGSVSQGGSTLTQQYVKNVLLERADTKVAQKSATEKSIDRKLREARYALALEKRLTKNQILERYLNIAYFGNGAYGVGTAAQHYFGTSSSKINLAQAALLAGLVKSPAQFDPSLHPKAARERRDLVLDRMLALNLAPPAEVALAKKQPIKLTSVTRKVDACETSIAPFFCDYIRTQLLADPTFGSTRVEREGRLFAGGLQVHTTLDPAVQKAAQQSVDSTIERTNRVATAIVVIQPGTGNILALAINRNYGQTRDGYTKVNYAVVDDQFQPGSTFKAFTLAAAIQQGISVHTRIKAPACYNSKIYPHGHDPAAAFCADGYSNAADSEAGTFDLYSGTAQSVNTFFVQLEERVGVDKVAAMAQLLGVHTDALKRGIYGGSLTLGGTTVSPMQMADAYATFAARGLHCEPKAISAILDSEFKPVTFTPPAPCKQVIPQNVADTVSSILQGVISGGTGYPNAVIGRPAAGKTGTTDDYRAAWFVGYVPQMAAAVWVGDPRGGSKYPLRNVTTYGRTYAHVFGGDLGALVWGRAMKAALVGYPPLPFAYPNLTGSADVGITVPDVNNHSVNDARQILINAGFSVKIDPRKIPAYPIPNGYVAAMSPAPGTQLPIDSTVTLFVSNGERPLPTFQPQPTDVPSPTPTPSPSPPPETPSPSPGSPDPTPVT